MKKILTIALLSIVMFSLTACKSGGSDVNSVEAIKKKGELVLLTESGFPPFEYADNSADAVNGVNGVDIEFGKKLAEKLGVTLKVVDMDFDSLTLALGQNKGDIIAAGMTADAERAEVVDFSQKYFDNGLFVLVPMDTDIVTLDDLQGKKIAVQQGTTGDKYAAKIEGAEVLQLKGMVESGIAVSNGNADASIMDVLTAQIMVANNPKLTILEAPVELEETAIAVAKGNETLLAVVNELLTELQSDGTLDQWFDTHFQALLEE